MLLEIKNLDYQINDIFFFKDFNLKINTGEYISIIAPNKSGKTMLTKLLCAIYPTFNKIILDDILLNKENVLKYITKIGIVSNELNQDFLFNTLKEELKYPLNNLGLRDIKVNKRIKEIISFFEVENILNNNIKTMSNSQKSMLLIIISLIHNPKLLVLDDAFNNMNYDDKVFMLMKLKELNEKGLTILNITSKLDTIYDSNKVLLMEKFQITKEGTLEEMFQNASYLDKIGLQIPPIIDLSLKLKNYKLIKKIYFDNEELEKELWK